MTHRPTFVSKYSSQGFSQQLSKSTNKTCVPRNTFINGGNLQPAEFYTKDSCKLFQQLVTECTDQYRLYSLAHLLQQPVTEELMEKIEFNTVKIVVNFIQQLVTQCTYWLHSLVHLLQKLVTECADRLPAEQPCTLTSITGYSMYLPATGFTALYSSLNWLQGTGYTALYTGFNNWLQSVPAGTGYTAGTLTSTTGYSMYRPATGFTALYSSLNWLQCTGYTTLYTGFNNWLQSVPGGIGYTA